MAVSLYRPKVFISHSAKEGLPLAVLTHLQAALADDFEVLLDQRVLAPGDEWRAVIDDWIVMCDVALVLLLLGGSFYLMCLMAFGPNGLNAWTKFFYVAYISVSFASVALFLLHQQGVFPHAKIAIRDTAGGNASGGSISMTGVLSLIIQIVRLIADYFIQGPRMEGRQHHRPARAAASLPRAAE